MIKRIIVTALLSLILFHSSAFAADGEVVFRDALYGAAIGGILGIALWAGDQEDFGDKMSGGVVLGTLAGLVYGLVETDSFVELKDNKIKVAIPTPIIIPSNNDVLYSASLFKARF